MSKEKTPMQILIDLEIDGLQYAIEQSRLSGTYERSLYLNDIKGFKERIKSLETMRDTVEENSFMNFANAVCVEMHQAGEEGLIWSGSIAEKVYNEKYGE